MKLLIYSWLHEFTLNDIINTFNKIAVQFDLITLDLFKKDKSNCQELYDKVYNKLSSCGYDAVFSVNYFPDVAKACFAKNTRYISWTYDCPLDIENISDTISLPTNRAFFFDKEQYLEYDNTNNTVYHFPLAVNPLRSQVKYSSDYSSDISFVGRIYHSSFPALTKYMNEFNKGYLKGLIESQKNVYGTYLVKDALSESYLKDLNKDLKDHNCPFTLGEKSVSLKQIAYSLATEATFENRLMCLGLLSIYLDLKWYTTPDSETLNNIKKYPPVDYDKEMPIVFKSSKINLHIGLHAIPSGISLRQLDIMSCGGFLLSSFQPELFDFFIPGEDFDFFSSPEEALDKAKFYISNESVREKIVRSGTEKTNSIFSYEERIPKLLSLAME
ncbi:MAG: DUF3880 domain-containing protein [Lachnospiraceae bacterium]|nr:DUF3880 domain-containing protein [Lachnospiraceae bacterium]